MGAPTGRHDPRGLLKVTRHPMLAAFAVFGIAHMLMNGWAGDVIFFGMFPVLAVISGVHQDGRKLRELGDGYRGFKAQTSIVPFAALISGRVKWQAADTPWSAISGGIFLTAIIVALHPMIFGGNPLG